MNSPTMCYLNVSITQSHESSMQEAINNGSYGSISEIVYHAIQLWKQDKEVGQVEISSLEKLPKDGSKPGGFQDEDQAAIVASLKANSLGTS